MWLDSGRLTDPVEINEVEASRLIDEGTLRAIQFERPPQSTAVLEQLNALCRKHGERLEVRFYGFYGSAFDARVLRHLPDVVSLATDCLDRIQNESVLAELPRLRKLSFGVYAFDRPDFVGLLPLEQLTELALTASRKRNFDLSPLQRCVALEELYIDGHSNNIAAIARTPRLNALTLRGLPKRSTLEFLNCAPSLRQIRLLLGSRESIAEFSNHGIERLRVCWVRGLSDLGPLCRFSALQELSIADQLRLVKIDARGSSVQRLWVFNCKNLSSIAGLKGLDRLRELRVGDTALNLGALRDARWGPAMEVVGLYSRSNRWNNETQRLLEQRGYGDTGGPMLWA
jgi:hypothetical protein